MALINRRLLNDDHGFIIILVGFLTITTILQISLFEIFFSPSDDLTSFNDIGQTNSQQTKPQSKPVSSAAIDNPDVIKSSLRPLEEILAAANVQVDDELKQSLPPLEDIIDMYGSEPIILGTERCETFRSTVEKGEAFVGPAGMFNTGTNLLSSLLIENCYLPDRMAKYGQQSKGIRDTVPWGKHSPVSFRNHHVTKTSLVVNQTSFLPAVVVKDPLTWMTSMCRHPYEAHWRELPDHCPNLVPTTPQEVRDLNGDKTYRVKVKFNPNITYYDSFADLWSKWYRDWLDVDFPRLMIRFEDLLFHTESVVGQVCSCAGGKMFNGPFKYIQDSAKQGGVHKGANGLVKSMLKYGNKNNRASVYKTEDLAYARDHLKQEILETFHYKSIPN